MNIVRVCLGPNSFREKLSIHMDKMGEKNPISEINFFKVRNKTLNAMFLALQCNFHFKINFL